ncbi:MAG: multidrug DMT transporter permease [Gammaproteobacteria bacterium]
MRKMVLLATMILWSSLGFALSFGPDMDCVRHYCAAVIDAGSSGSRIHWYMYDKDRQDNPIHIKDVVSKKIKPGLSSVKQDSEHIAQYMEELMSDFSQSNVPVFLYATAGMRLLSDQSQEQYYSEIKQWFSKHPQWQLHDARTISGKEEGVYGWVSLNYYLQTLQNQDKPQTGLIEIGGASAQIVFPVQDTSQIEAEDLAEFKLYGRDISLYSHSFLGLGINELFASSQEQNTCFASGYPLKNNTFAAGDAKQCQAEISKILQQDFQVDKETASVLQKNPVDNWYTVSAVAMMVSGPPFEFAGQAFTGQSLLQEGNAHYCQKSHQYLLNKYSNNDYVQKNCLLTSYFYSLLVDGLKLSPEQIIHYAPDYDGNWTTGALLINDHMKK